jgi:hypothetical protein
MYRCPRMNREDADDSPYSVQCHGVGLSDSVERGEVSTPVREFFFLTAAPPADIYSTHGPSAANTLPLQPHG